MALILNKTSRKRGKWDVFGFSNVFTERGRKLPGPGPVYLDICLFSPSSDWSSHTFSLSSVCHIFIRTFLAALMSAMSSMMSSCKLNWLPVGDGVAPPAESLRLGLGPLPGSVAIDSRLLRPNSGMGALLMVITECRRPAVYGPGAWVSVARNAFSRAAAPAAPWSLSRRTWKQTAEQE